MLSLVLLQVHSGPLNRTVETNLSDGEGLRAVEDVLKPPPPGTLLLTVLRR